MNEMFYPPLQVPKSDDLLSFSAGSDEFSAEINKLQKLNTNRFTTFLQLFLQVPTYFLRYLQGYLLRLKQFFGRTPKCIPNELNAIE